MFSRRTIRPGLAGLLLVVAGILPAREGHAQTPVSLEAVEGAWKRRQEKVRSARFEWTEQRTVAKGSSSAMLGLARPELVAGKVIPPKDTTLEDEYVLVLDGQKLRLETSTHYWSFKNERYEPSASVTTFDGTLGKQLSPRGTPDHRWPQGSIRAEKHHMEATSPLLRPILMTYRGLVPEMRSNDLLAMHLTGRTLRLGKQVCVELHRREKGSQVDENSWLDPTRDFVIVRSVFSRNGEILNQFDVDYKPSAEAGWMPERWSTVIVNMGGKYRLTYRAAMTAYQFDPKVNDKTFDIEFPPGTIGVDLRDSKRFLVAPNGATRTLGGEQRGETYQRLVETVEKETRVTRNWTWGTVAAVVLGTASLLLLCIRRWRLRPWGRSPRLPAA